MPTALGIQNTNFALPSSAITPSAMLGGTPANPIAPTVTLVSANGANNIIAIDPLERYYYYADGSGAIHQYNIATGALVTLAGPTNYGISTTRVVDMIISLDGTMLYVLTNQFTIATVLVASPNTCTTVIGTLGTAGTADGAGVAASINATTGWMAPDPTGTHIYLQNSSAFRTITIAGWGVVTTFATGQLSRMMTATIAGNLYYGDTGAINQVQLTSGGAGTKLGQNASVSSGNWGWIPDVRKPMERCIYAAGAGAAALWRYDLNTGVFTQIATLPGNVNPQTNRAMQWAGNKLYICTTVGVVKVF